MCFVQCPLEDLHNIDKVVSTMAPPWNHHLHTQNYRHLHRLPFHAKDHHNSKMIYTILWLAINLLSHHTSFWRSETVMSIVGNCEKIGWKRMLTQPWIDMGDFVTRWCSNLFYPGATPHYPFPLNVSTPLCYDTLLTVHCGLNCCTAPQYGVQLTALHRRERT